MGDLPAAERDRHSLVKRGGPEPERRPVHLLALAPEPHVVATAWARVHLALEREVLTAPLEEEVAHRRARIGTVEPDRPDDAERAPHGDGTGGEPPGTLHGDLHISDLPVQTHVDGIGRMPVGIGGPPRRQVTPPETAREADVLREYESGTFFRQFSLSETIDQTKIDAQLNNGVLRLELPKVERARPRQISVRNA
jgi:hypothetical protein